MGTLQERLKACRKQTGLSQENLAKEIGIVFRSYRRYECGEVDPPFSAIVKIADYFNVSLDFLAGRTDEP